MNKNEEVWECPHCKEWTICVMTTRGYRTTRRGFTGRSGPVWHKGNIILMTEKCPNCKKGVSLRDFQ